jgi:hypothetical protein
MGSKPSNAFQMNRPESGGADRDELREKSGLLEREKQEFAASEKATKEANAREISETTADEPPFARIDSDQGEPREEPR